MKLIKKRLYYDNTGYVFFELDLYGETTIEKDISDFKQLSERNRDSFDVLEIPDGAYEQDYAECSGYRVNTETKELEFSYPDPNEPEVEQPYQVPLSEKVASLEQESMILQLALAETIEKQEVDKVGNQVAMAELVETLIIKGVL